MTTVFTCLPTVGDLTNGTSFLRAFDTKEKNEWRVQDHVILKQSMEDGRSKCWNLTTMTACEVYNHEKCIPLPRMGVTLSMSHARVKEE